MNDRSALTILLLSLSAVGTAWLGWHEHYGSAVLGTGIMVWAFGGGAAFRRT